MRIFSHRGNFDTFQYSENSTFSVSTAVSNNIKNIHINVSFHVKTDSLLGLYDVNSFKPSIKNFNSKTTIKSMGIQNLDDFRIFFKNPELSINLDLRGKYCKEFVNLLIHFIENTRINCHVFFSSECHNLVEKLRDAVNNPGSLIFISKKEKFRFGLFSKNLDILTYFKLKNQNFNFFVFENYKDNILFRRLKDIPIELYQSKINDIRDLEKCICNGIQGLITDHPKALANYIKDWEL